MNPFLNFEILETRSIAVKKTPLLETPHISSVNTEKHTRGHSDDEQGIQGLFT
jgi:hypothetical protein